jgi:hypothetical protein
MPDALSKTIPIWSAVLNRALFPSETAYHAVALPPDYLGASEEAQIESRIEGFVYSLKVCSTLHFLGCIQHAIFPRGNFSGSWIFNIQYSSSFKSNQDYRTELAIPLDTITGIEMTTNKS